MGRIDAQGNRKIYHVNEETFAKSVHGRVPCRGCHVGIAEIPHKVITQKVDCGVQCHKKEPSTGRDFSHRGVYKNYKRGVHGTDLRNPEPGKPVCKYCHQNPLYTRTSIGREKPIERVLARCQACHTEKEWAHTFYMHVEHRLMKRTMRGRLQVVELCASCHADKDLMKSKGLSKKAINAVDTYKMTYHWKALELGRTDTADCLDCHTYYEPYNPDNIHLILRTSDPEASIHPNNKGKICGQDFCHDGKNAAGPKAGPNLANLNMHMDWEDPEHIVEFITAQMFFVLTFGTLAFLFIWMFLELLRRLF
ncbi:MAG: hypothetical protein HZA78_10020 [Candidatus Schekmanbacteria bacterium]|nr:hypothetical protein [Candidatus Schekmanbacteria bacterium]